MPPPPVMPQPIRLQTCHCNKIKNQWALYLAAMGNPTDSAAFNNFVSGLCWEVSPFMPAWDFWTLLKACDQAFEADDNNQTPAMNIGTTWSSFQKNALDNLFYSSDTGLFYPGCDGCGSSNYGLDTSHNPFYSRHYKPFIPPTGGKYTGPGGPDEIKVDCDSFFTWLDSFIFATGGHDYRGDFFAYGYRGTLTNPAFAPTLLALRDNFYVRFPHASKDAVFTTPEQKVKDFFSRYMSCFDDEFNYESGACCYRLNEKAYRLFMLFKEYAKQRSGKTYNHFYYNGWSLYPDMEEYYNTSLYQGSHDASTTNKLLSNKMPGIKFMIIDTYGDTSRIMLNYPHNYNNRAFFARISQINTFELKSFVENCDTTHYFQLTGKQKDVKGRLFDITLNGWSEKYRLVDTCGRTYPEFLLCDKKQEEIIPDIDPCAKRLEFTALYKASQAYQAYRDSVKNSIRQAYINHCRKAWHNETFTMEWTLQEYHYTLYYYDQAGNLIQTIPPDGVNPLTSGGDLLAVKTARKNNTTGTYPTHTFKTRYKFNTLNELVWQVTPDAGVSEFWYDNVGRLVVSRNAKQKPLNDYSYTLFDGLGRIKEVGAVNNIDTMSWAISFDREDLAYYILDGTRREVTQTWYDNALIGMSIPAFSQDNLRSRVATMTYEETHDGDSLTYDYGIHFTYDPHGVVPEMVRENQKLAGTSYDNHQFKYIGYDYDLHSGKVNGVDYQAGQADRFYHRYKYDADLRLTKVYAGNAIYALDQEAEYYYYLHGPLMRSEIGNLKVQGLDYAYTIHGWIKGVNSGTLKSNRDIGQDGEIGSAHEMVARDVFGYSLGFYRGDYKAIGQSSGEISTTDFFMPALPSASGYNMAAPDLWNGNIRHMQTALKPFMADSSQPQGMAYGYDQLNRIVSARAWSNVTVAANTWRTGGSAMGKYQEDYTYDGNGNIQTLKRSAINQVGTTRLMDNFIYHYTSGKNQLEYVDDTVTAAAFTEDIDDQSAANYLYDEIGNLIFDASEEIDEIQWNVYGKIKAVIRDALSTKPDLEFEYDPMGNRTLKRVITKGVGARTIETLYIRDANGNEMATYMMVEDSTTWNSASIYGSSRMGLYEQSVLIDVSGTPQTSLPADEQLVFKGYRKYELSNHLGNVLMVISDKRTTVCDISDDVLYYEADIVMAQDYYPFGMAMPGRTYSNDNYKFGFNGKEEDKETNNYDYGFRIYNNRLGKFLSVDPLFQSYPWYTTYQFAGNTPIQAIDLDGLEEYIVTYYKKFGHLYATMVTYVFVSERIDKKADDMCAVYTESKRSVMSGQPGSRLDKKTMPTLISKNDVSDVAKKLIETVDKESVEPGNGKMGYGKRILEFGIDRTTVNFTTNVSSTEEIKKNISQPAKDNMETFAVLLLENPELGMQIEGFADAQGVAGKSGTAKTNGEAANQVLSENRANALKAYIGDYLKSQNVDQKKIDNVLSRIYTKGMGTQTSTNDASDGSNAANRKAEARLTNANGSTIAPADEKAIGEKYGITN